MDTNDRFPGCYRSSDMRAPIISKLTTNDREIRRLFYHSSTLKKIQ